MNLFDSKSPFIAMQDLLKRERAAILNGKYEELETIAEEKERLNTGLMHTQLPQAELSELREMSQRNALLFDAMRAGIGSALERLRALREPVNSLKTYDETGHMTELSTARVKNERRA